MHLIDSSIILAVLTGTPAGVWARAKLESLQSVGGVFINQIIYSETCTLAESRAEADEWLTGLVQFVALNWECAYPAGQAYRLYKARGGKKSRMLPDFLIAAHAQSMGWKLMTNNAADVTGYFPALKIISPPKV